MRTAAIKVTHLIEFELQTVDHPGLWRFLLVLGFTFSGPGAASNLLVFVFLGGFQFLRTGVAKNENELAAVWRPCKVLDILRGVCKALRVPAEPVEEPDLGLAFIASRKKSKELAIGTPSRVSGRNAVGG